MGAKAAPDDAGWESGPSATLEGREELGIENMEREKKRGVAMPKNKKYESIHLSLFAHVLVARYINDKLIINDGDWAFFIAKPGENFKLLKDILNRHFKIGNKEYVEITVTQKKVDGQ